MNVSLIQLGIAVALILAIAAMTASFALRAGRAGAEPVIKGRFKELRRGWYQLAITVANRAPYGLVGVSLRRVRPRAARLMAPIMAVSTRKGDFQVWSDPGVDKRTAMISLEFLVGPHEAPRGIPLVASKAQVTAWLFLPEKSNPAEVTLELALRDGGGGLRRYRFVATREAAS